MPSIPKGERWRCPECSKDLAFSQRRRHIKTRHPDTDLVSVLEWTDAPPVEGGHTFKRENRSRRFRRKLSSGPQQKVKEPSTNKINCSNSSGSEEALPFKTVDHHAPSTTTVIDRQPELVMWIPVNPVEDRVDGQRTLRVAVPAASEEDSRFPWLSKVRLERYRDSLGDAFVYFGQEEDNDWYFHQGVVTMELLRHYCKCPIELVPWSTFWNDKRKVVNSKVISELLLATNSPRRALVILFWAHDARVSDDLLSKLYGQLEAFIMKVGLDLTVFPRSSEVAQARGKVKDILTLDEIAKETGEYRPITCFPGRQCVLQDVASFHKRNNSSGCEHTGKMPRNHRGELSCIVSDLRGPATSATSRAISTGGYVWFHQEIVNTFDEIGEFRAFLATEPSSSGELRGLMEKVVHICKTSFDKDTILPQEATPEDLSGCPSLSLDRLRDFAVRIYRRLRERHDWREAFESLEVGVRLDICVSPDRDGFFVNEITRWWFADFFSDDILANPKHRLCDAFARATKHYFFRCQKSVHM